MANRSTAPCSLTYPFLLQEQTVEVGCLRSIILRPRSFVFVVCSPHPRAGVTTTATLLTEYFAWRGLTAEGFDTDPYESAFANRFPNQVQVTDISTIQGQISLFDKLLVFDDKPRIVDVWNRSFQKFFTILQETGFAEEARRLSIEIVLIYCADELPASLVTAKQISLLWPDIPMIVVANEGAAEFHTNVAPFLASFPTRISLHIRELDQQVSRSINKDSFSYAEFLKSPPFDMSIIVRSALRKWLVHVFTQFQRLEQQQVINTTEYF